MDRSKLVAVITGAVSLLLAVGYLVLVQLLDFRGDMVPAPLSALPQIWPSVFDLSPLTYPVFF